MQFADDQAASRIVLDTGRVLTKCDQCREMHADRIPPTVPPCEVCWVDLKEENEDAAKIFQSVRGQIITYKEKIVDINHLAIDAALKRYGIADSKKCFDKVVKLFHSMLDEYQKKGK